MNWRHCRPPDPLTAPRVTPEYPVVSFLPLPRKPGVAVPFTFTDAFDDFAREHKLPDCAVSFLSRAGTWSARASKSGFAPSTMHAEFSSDPDQAVRLLLAAGAVRRVKAGVRITESPCWTMVNAKDVTRDAEREQAEAGERRAAWRGRKQRQRDAEKAEHRDRIAAGISGTSRGTNADVTPENPGNAKNPQVSGDDVPRDMGVTSRGTAKKTASDYQDQNQSPGVNPVNARAGEAPDPAIVTLVTGLLAKRAERIVSAAEACRAIAAWDKRAEKAGKAVRDPVKFYKTCAGKERDLVAILAPPAGPQWEELGTAPEPLQVTHAFEPSGIAYDRSCMHPGCGLPEKNQCHPKRKESTG